MSWPSASIETGHTAEDLELPGGIVADVEYFLDWRCEAGEAATRDNPGATDSAECVGLRIDFVTVWTDSGEPLRIDAKSNPAWCCFLRELLENMLHYTKRLGELCDLEQDALGRVEYWEQSGRRQRWSAFGKVA